MRREKFQRCRDEHHVNLEDEQELVPKSNTLEVQPTEQFVAGRMIG